MITKPAHVDELTPLERYVDDLLRFENADRYRAQSAATRVNDPAPIPRRAPALPFVQRSNAA